MGGIAAWRLDDPDQLLRKLRELEKRAPVELERHLLEQAEAAARSAAARMPPGSSELAKGWRVGPVKRASRVLSVEISHPAPEAARLEYGTEGEGGQRGRFMLALALAELERDWPRRLESVLETLFSGKGAGR
ncbi:HK97 gp10 family phage protein [Paenibacillus albicereus]|uniref:HK97 gp10 family phage protein n=1 Tax=Paenibacillus albicereus TaxID=2726185 RepID=A0A6H2H0A6_9BACL|nr:HK97 gp10 family phage protein [Paenibacillus albicereus]QJC53121.1 HK97 gp10 family phage protein [Paenibacillus albicereus]